MKDNKIKEIKKMKRRGDSLNKIGRKFKVTGERIRQILRSDKIKLKYCKIHNLHHENECRYCTLEINYLKNIDLLLKKNFDIEIDRLSKSNRSKSIVIQRSILIKKLKDDFGMSFSEIANKLKRDRTTISHIYYSLKSSRRIERVLKKYEKKKINKRRKGE